MANGYMKSAQHHEPYVNANQNDNEITPRSSLMAIITKTK